MWDPWKPHVVFVKQLVHTGLQDPLTLPSTYPQTSAQHLPGGRRAEGTHQNHPLTHGGRSLVGGTELVITCDDMMRLSMLAGKQAEGLTVGASGLASGGCYPWEARDLGKEGLHFRRRDPPPPMLDTVFSSVNGDNNTCSSIPSENERISSGVNKNGSRLDPEIPCGHAGCIFRHQHFCPFPASAGWPLAVSSQLALHILPHAQSLA